jgi:hypothetical protein
VDIVLSDLLVGMHYMKEMALPQLVAEYSYPNYTDTKIRAAYYSGTS